jgi:hypothetical protein
MKYFYFSVCLLVLGKVDLSACGYNFVGGCSSHLSLGINGTVGRFAIDPCNSETQYQGLQLGTIRTLAISGAEVITWESCINNVTAATMYYRVYPAAQSGGAWNNFAVPEDYNTIEGPYTTRYRKATNNINLHTGLTVGTNYILEVYVRAEIDTLGDDFVPETFILKNNNGANYKLQFTYGGPNAPALTTVVTRKTNVACWGQSTGVLGVTVFGGQATGSLFYQWSAFTQNFFQIGDLPAGTYTVTVTESPSGNTSTRSAQITQPQLPISLNFTNITPASCATSGLATVAASGGTAPLTWQWSNGQTTATAQFPVSGDYAITITDANGCTQKGMLEIPGTGTVNVFELPVICAGETHMRGGQTFSQEGLYTVNIPAPNGCDSVIQFYLNVVEGSNYLANISNTSVTCTNPNISVCAETGAATYTWRFNNAPLGNTSNCLNITQGGNYEVALTTTENGKTCLFEKAFSVEEHLDPPVVTTSGSGRFLGPCGTGQIEVTYKAFSTAPIASYEWYLGTDLLSDSAVWVYVSPSVPAQGLFYLNVTNVYGCENTLTNIGPVVITIPSMPSIFDVEQRTNCDGTIDVEVLYFGGNNPVNVTWSNGSTGKVVTLPPGFVEVVVSDTLGCQDARFVIVEEYSIVASAQPAYNSTTPNGSVSVQVKGAAALPTTYLWSNGSTLSAVYGLLPGTYCVTVTEGGGCTRTACALVESIVSTTQPFGDGNSLMVVPNPVNAGAEVTSEAFAEGGLWQLVAPDGRICAETVVMPAQNTVPIPANLCSGVYVAIFRTEKFILTNKIFLNAAR